MTPRLIFWLASGLGAAIFIALGTLLARLRAQAAPAMPAGGAETSEVGALRREVGSLQERLGAAITEAETLRTKLRESVAERATKDDDFGVATTVNDAATHEAILRVGVLEQERDKWVADRAAAQAALAERDRKLAAASQGEKKARAAASQAMADIAKARQETAAARRQAEEAAKEVAAARRAAEEATEQAAVEEALRRDLQAALDAKKGASGQRASAATLRGTGGDARTERKGERVAIEAAEASRAYAEGALVAAQARLAEARKETETQKQRLAVQQAEADAALAAAQARLQRQEAAAKEQWAAREADLRAEQETHLERLRAELEVERQIAAQARAEVDAAQAQVASRSGWAERAEALETERFELREQLRQLEAQVEELSSLQAVVEEYESMKVEAMALRQRAGDAKRLAEEIARLRDQLAEAESSRADLASELERLSGSDEERMDLALRVKVLESHLVELKVLRQQKAAMVAREGELVRLRQDLDTLRDENANLRAQGFIVKDAPLAPRKVGTDGEGRVASFEKLLTKVLEADTARCAVLADELGLVVAGGGEHADALAALSAMHDELAQRVGGLLPLGTLARISLADENGLYFTAQPVMTDVGRLLLATVSVKQEFDATSLERRSV